MDSAPIRADWVGRVVDGKFGLLQWLGSSDAGGVFLAELHGLPQKRAAVEFVPADAENAEALTAQWALAAPLSHPHLIRLIDSGKCEIDTSFLIYAVTEYPEEVLSEILPERPLSPTEAGETLGPIVDVLAYLHGNGIVHGHLKPSNILVVGDQVKLSSRQLCSAGKTVVETGPRSIHDAPETLSEPISPAADIWSLGVTLVEALTQSPVWERSAGGEPIVPASIPEPFHTIVQECLRTDPARRCTLSDIKARLQQSAPVAAQMEPVQAEQVAPEPGRTEPVLTKPVEDKLEAGTPIAIGNRTRHRGVAILAAAVFLIALTVMLVLHFHHEQPPLSSGQPPVPASSSPVPVQADVAPLPSASSAPAPSAVPAPAPVAGPTPPSSGQAPASETSTKDATAGDVAERAMPDLLPSAVQSIHGVVNVKVRVTVDASGNVESASLDAPGPSKYFAKMSLQAAQNWKFKPAQADGESTSRAWILNFKFTQAGADVTPVQVTP